MYFYQNQRGDGMQEVRARARAIARSLPHQRLERRGRR